MRLKNKATGEIEFLRHGPAVDAVTAGTHEFAPESETDAANAADVPAKAEPKKADPKKD